MSWMSDLWLVCSMEFNKTLPFVLVNIVVKFIIDTGSFTEPETRGKDYEDLWKENSKWI